MPIGRPVTAAAVKIRFGRDQKRKITEASWEDRAWDSYDRLPELHYGIGIRSHIAEKFDYFAARRATPVAEPDRLGETDEGETVSQADQAVIDVLDAEGGPDLIRRLVTASITHFDVVGREFLVAFETDEGRVWKVLSTQELRRNVDREGRFVRVDIDGTLLPDEDPIDDENVFVVWRPHPRNSRQSDSPLKASLEVAEQLILLNREMRARSFSRLPAGMLLLPDSMDIGDDEDENTPTDSFERELTDRMMAPIEDHGSAGSVTPWVVTADGDDIDKIKHLTFDRKWDVSKDDREELIRRLANGMDLPPEILLGVADLNHWSLWAVQETTITQHVDPSVRDILDSLTVGWFRPLLEAAGVASVGVVLWRDYTPAVVPADQSTQHFEALGSGLIGFDAARERLGYDEEEAPTPEDLALIAKLGGNSDPSAVTAPVRGPAQSPRPGEDEPPEIPPNGQATVTPALLQNIEPIPELESLFLDALADCDASTFEFVLTQSEVGLDRALEKAGSRMRSEVRKNPELRTAARGIPNNQLGLISLGRELFQGTDVVIESDFDAVIARIKVRLARTQTEARSILDEILEVDTSPDPEEENDLETGMGLLRSILLTAALAALFTPGGEPDPADVGELRDLRLPASEIRDAVSVVGGGTSQYADTGTWELICNGRRTQTRLQDAGASTLSFIWRYGDPASRVTNFDPHRRLNGTRFDTWNDPALEQTGEGAWVAGSHFRPGDHRGCLCRYTREVTLQVRQAAAV